MSEQQRSQYLRQLAAKHGFPLCRITRPSISAAHKQALLSWLAAGMHADMTWMAETTRLERRLNPASLLKGTASVVVLGMPYSPPVTTPSHHATAAVISAYAAGDDYHEVMKKRLRALCRELQAMEPEVPPEQRIYVDTAPVLEHALAEAAGLGWLGRHSLNIDKNYGSWFFLGEIFTTARLAPDSPVTAHCGSCTACIKQCPTGAIVAPGTVDARRCISWLTIEYRGDIPLELRPLMGLHVYGCDDCQLCCPWNHKLPTIEDALRPRPDNQLPPLAELLQLDETQFRQRFRQSPIKRSGRALLLRNCCVAAGNAGDRRLLPLLYQLLDDHEPLIRSHAEWAVKQLQ